MVITSSEGRSRALLISDAPEIGWLDGHLLEVEGTNRPKAIHVKTWRVVEGLHGLSCWVGVVQDSPEGIILWDRDNQIPLRLDPGGQDVLMGEVGRPVLIEGYVEGGLGVHVMYWRPLHEELSPE